MYMTIKEFYETLGKILERNKNVDQSMLITASCVILPQDVGFKPGQRTIPVGSVVFECKSPDELNQNTKWCELSVMPERLGKWAN